jgi:hypothetical protein
MYLYPFSLPGGKADRRRGQSRAAADARGSEPENVAGSDGLCYAEGDFCFAVGECQCWQQGELSRIQV